MYHRISLPEDSYLFSSILTVEVRVAVWITIAQRYKIILSFIQDRSQA